MAVFYRPILAGRAGEFEALSHITEPTVHGSLPIVEVLPREDKQGPVLPEDTGIRGTARYFNRLLRNLIVKYYRPDGLMRFALDTTALPADPGLPAGTGVLRDALEQAAMNGIAALPVVRLADPTAWQDVAGWQPRLGMILRLVRADFQQSDTAVLSSVQAALHGARTPGRQTDLLIDLETTPRPTQLTEVAARVRPVIGSRFWRSVTVASGAFPKDLRGIEPWTLTAIARRTPPPGSSFARCSASLTWTTATTPWVTRCGSRVARRHHRNCAMPLRVAGWYSRESRTNRISSTKSAASCTARPSSRKALAKQMS